MLCAAKAFVPDPLRSYPLLPLDDRAATMERMLVKSPIGMY